MVGLGPVIFGDMMYGAVWYAMLRNRLRIIIGIIVLMILALIYQNSNSSDTLITKDVSEMLPIISQPALTNEINETYAARSYQFFFQHDKMVLKYEIFKYSSLEDAETNYLLIKNNYSEMSILNLGNDGFGIEQKEYSVVVFRTLNILTRVELDGKYTTLDRTITYAKKLRI